MLYNLVKLHDICKDRDELVRMLMLWKIIPNENEYPCRRCKGFMKLMRDSGRVDGWVWYCSRKWGKPKKKRTRCSISVGIRTRTFLAGSKLSMFQILGFAHLWCEGASLKLISMQLEVSKESAMEWASFFREIIFDYFVLKAEKLGGFGKTVEIFQSTYGKRKHHRGRPVEGQVVFGGYEQVTGRVFMVAVENRDADTLLPLIEQWIEEETTLVSDFWRTHDCLNREGYQLLKDTHTLQFQDRKTDANTNTIDARWRAEMGMIASPGRRRGHVPGNVARYMFYRVCHDRKLDRTEHFLKMAREVYNPVADVETKPNVLQEVPVEDYCDFEDFQEAV